MTESDNPSRDPGAVEATARRIVIPPPTPVRDELVSTAVVREVMHGTWWAADTPEQAVPGVLVLEHGADPQLELHQQLVPPRRRELFTVHGESGGEKVTLLGAAVTETVTQSTGHGRYVRQVVEALTAR